MPEKFDKQFLLPGRLKALGFLLLGALLGGAVYHLELEPTGLSKAEGLARQQAADSTVLSSAALEGLFERMDASQHRIELGLKSLEALAAGLKSDREDLESRLAAQDLEADASLLRGMEDVEAVKTMAEANSASLDLMKNEAELSPALRKRLLIHPTIQLRGNGTVGSGVLVYSGPFAGAGPGEGHCNLALTAFHVVSEILGDRFDRKIEQVKLFSPGLEPGMAVTSARLVVFDKAKDIALLRLDTKRKNMELARVGKVGAFSRLDVFSPVCAVGCPLGNSPLATMGQITSLDKEVEGESFWMVNAPTFFGNSGGGVYSVPDCNLVGIFSMIYTYGKARPTVVPHMGLFFPMTGIADWLKQEGFDFVFQGGEVPATAWKELAYNPREISAEVGD